MSEEHLAFSVVILFAVLFLFSLVYSFFYYKKHLEDYNRFISEYRKQGLFVDSLTNLSENFGFMFFYLKIMFFIRLLKNKKINVVKNVSVDKRCYDYMQSMPEHEIKWMWKWRRNYFIQSALLCVTLFAAYIHSVIYSY